MSKKPQKLEKLTMQGVLPQCKEIEEAVLAACLLDKRVFPIISKILNTDDFYEKPSIPSANFALTA